MDGALTFSLQAPWTPEELILKDSEDPPIQTRAVSNPPEQGCIRISYLGGIHYGEASKEQINS